jgi:hypothetical protein
MEKENALQIDLRIDRMILSIIIFCLVAEFIIFFLDISYNLGQLWYFEKFQRVSNVDAEKSFGTWFSVVQNFVVALTAFVISLHHKLIFNQKGKFLGWLLMALFFAYISLDDHLMLHENMGSTVPVIYEWLLGKTITLPTYGWHFLSGPIFGAFGLFFLTFLYRQLNSKKYRLILFLGLSLWSVAVLLDAWDGTSRPYDWMAKMTGFKEYHIRHSSMLVEEMFEMLGSTLFLYLFLSKIKSHYTKQQIFLKISR